MNGDGSGIVVVNRLGHVVGQENIVGTIKVLQDVDAPTNDVVKVLDQLNLLDKAAQFGEGAE